MKKKSSKHSTVSRERERKREQFQPAGPAKVFTKRRLAALLAVLVFGLFAYYLFVGGEGESKGALGWYPMAAKAGEDVRLPVAEIAGGEAKFFSYELANSQAVNFFVLQSSDGVIRAAFDACDVCFKSKRGYRQAGDDMVCRNCGQHFPSAGVNIVRGGCNPAPLNRSIKGDRLVITARDLEFGRSYF